jgi:hypothetical protein
MTFFWRTKEFQELKKKWDKKLTDSGWNDIEYADGSLKSDGNRQTIAWDSKEAIEDYYRKVDSYLIEHDDISSRDRAILELYAEGVHIKGENSIVEQTGWSDKTCRRIINHYKDIIWGKK